MTRVDFYVIDSPAPTARETLICKLAEKAYALKHKIYIHTESAEQAQQLDEKLWTFRQGSFVPHSLYNSNEAELSPVLIGHNHEPEQQTDVLINASYEVPMFFSRFERVAEIVTNDEQQRQQARERFKFYKERGYQLETHNLSE